eukprot:CAMPEP_0178439056 /NCGR_PEP_ID=MMETSP0689_2-20121128/35944_1 /TAXON_ID=160604 /ORGANISM="Amphidinium massartii, Strain CS-259" /LENGTH=303 /DNA_ID=CAMNT_0020061543 /DNA_START=106 /DNA_END=1017 /DNA_ORIENTATION=-
MPVSSVPAGILTSTTADSLECPVGSQSQSPLADSASGAVMPQDTAVLTVPHLSGIAGYIPFDEVLSLRACSRPCLKWAMHQAIGGDGIWIELRNRIRARTWLRRIADVTSGTKDESIFETKMKGLVDLALRSRMETEMKEALAHMENQIRAFQAEVDNRLEEQERHIRSMVEQRVQEELGERLVSEVAKVQVMVEERVRDRISSIFKRELRETVRDLQTQLDSIAQEKDLLGDAFAEANSRAKFFFWATRSPLGEQSALAVGCGLPPRLVLSVRRRAYLHPSILHSFPLAGDGGSWAASAAAG